ncbi:MAG: hypothetical protein EHM61_03300 [Acidobacteria bacterium]|nr:MAG: hypothetical protein EHM61_03300 [Acidobacteriota bacterium]
MTRILALWSALFLINAVARPAINYLVFNHVDARHEALVQTVILPLAATVVLAAALGLITLRSLVLPLRAMRAHTLASLILMVDGLVLAVTIMPGTAEWLKLSQSNGFAGLYMGAKAIAAGAIIVWGSFSERWTDWRRRWLMLIGVLLCAYGLDYFIPWLGPLFGPLMANWNLLLGGLLVYGSLFLLVLLLFAALEAIWTRQSNEAGLAVRYAAAFAVLGATIICLGLFNRPVLDEPWASLVKACSYLALTGILAASMLAAISPSLRPRTND